MKYLLDTHIPHLRLNVFRVAGANKWLKSSSAFAKPKPMDAHNMFTAARTVCGLSEVSLASIACSFVRQEN